MDRGHSAFLRRFYGFFSGHFDRLMDLLYGGRDEAWRKAGLDELPDGGTVLEVGAGTGRTGSYARRSDPYLSLDVSRAMLGASSTVEHPVQGDAHALPFDDDSVDAAIAVLLFSTRINQRRALAELDRVVDPSGPIVLVDTFGGGSAPETALETALNVGSRSGCPAPAGSARLGTAPRSGACRHRDRSSPGCSARRSTPR